MPARQESPSAPLHGQAALAWLVAAVLAGCASSAGIAPQAQALSATQVGLPTAGAAAASPGPDWWRGFGDQALSDLVERALAGSPGLKLARARVERAGAVAAAQRAADEPQVNASADLTRQRFSATNIYPPPIGGSVRTLAGVQAGVGWEVDFFGRNQAALTAALGAGRAAQADEQAARVLLSTGVVRAYVQLARLHEQRTLAVRALRQREQTLQLIQQRVAGGLDTAVELRQGEGALPEARLQIEQIDEQIVLARNALAALTAQPPAALDGLAPSLAALRGAALPPSLPADLLGRRADLSAARWRVEAALHDTQAARAAFYPSINLAAFAGLSSVGLDRLAQTASGQFGAGPALRLPIFDAGRLRAQLAAKTADLDAAIESYNAALLDAVHEAGDGIASLRGIARQQAEQAEAQRAAESAYDLAVQRFAAGLSTYLTVLNAETQVLAQRRGAVDLAARALDTQAALVRSLGGGYVADDPPPPARR